PALEGGPRILGPGSLPQRLQHRGERGGASRGQVAVEPPRPPERDVQPDAPVCEPVVVAIGPVLAGRARPPLGPARPLRPVPPPGERLRRGSGRHHPVCLRAAVRPSRSSPAPRTGRSLRGLTPGRSPGGRPAAVTTPPRPPRRSW